MTARQPGSLLAPVERFHSLEGNQSPACTIPEATGTPYPVISDSVELPHVRLGYDPFRPQPDYLCFDLRAFAEHLRHQALPIIFCKKPDYLTAGVRHRQLLYLIHHSGRNDNFNSCCPGAHGKFAASILICDVTPDVCIQKNRINAVSILKSSKRITL